MKPAEILKKNNPQLYYLILEWKDNNITAFNNTWGSNCGIIGLSESGLRNLIGVIVDEALKSKIVL